MIQGIILSYPTLAKFLSRTYCLDTHRRSFIFRCSDDPFAIYISPDDKFDDVIFKILDSSDKIPDLPSLFNFLERHLTELYFISIWDSYCTCRLFANDFWNIVLTSMNILLFWASKILIVLFSVFFWDRKSCKSILYWQ